MPSPPDMHQYRYWLQSSFWPTGVNAGASRSMLRLAITQNYSLVQGCLHHVQLLSQDLSNQFFQSRQREFKISRLLTSFWSLQNFRRCVFIEFFAHNSKIWLDWVWQSVPGTHEIHVFMCCHAGQPPGLMHVALVNEQLCLECHASREQPLHLKTSATFHGWRQRAQWGVVPESVYSHRPRYVLGQATLT